MSQEKSCDAVIFGEYRNLQICYQKTGLQDALLASYRQAMTLLPYTDNRKIQTQSHIF